jgi:hypothetical protein
MPHPQNPSVQPPLNKPPSLSLPLAACCNDHQFATIAASILTYVNLVVSSNSSLEDRNWAPPPDMNVTVYQ